MKNKITRQLSLILFASALHLDAANTLKLKTDKTQGAVSFRAIGKPAFLKIDGKGEGPEGILLIDNKTMSGEMKFSLNSLTTGIDLRDEHMKDKYLNVKQNPMATLKFEKATLSSSPLENNGSLAGPAIQAKLTLNKITKEVSTNWETEKSGNDIKVKSNFSIKLSDFNIEVPEYAGIKVADEVKIESTTVLSPAEAPVMAR